MKSIANSLLFLFINLINHSLKAAEGVYCEYYIDYPHTHLKGRKYCSDRCCETISDEDNVCCYNLGQVTGIWWIVFPILACCIGICIAGAFGCKKKRPQYFNKVFRFKPSQINQNPNFFNNHPMDTNPMNYNYPDNSMNMYSTNNNMYSNLNTNTNYMNPYANTNSMSTYPNNYNPSVIDIPPPNYNHIIQNGYPAYVQVNSQYDTPMPALPASNKI